MQEGACGVACRVCVGGPIWQIHVNPQCRRWSPTWVWRAIGTWQLKLVAIVHMREMMMDSSEATMNASLGMERECKFKDWWRRWSFRLQGVHRRDEDDNALRFWLWWTIWVQQGENNEMASPSMTSGEQRQGGCHYNRCLGDQGANDKGKMVDDGQSKDSGGGMLVENCFNAENMATNRCILASLERELQAAFKFEDDKVRLVNSVWLVRILLGRLLRERTTLGRAIKQFAKF